MKRQVQIIKPDATAKEIDAMLKSGGGVAEVMSNTVLQVCNDNALWYTGLHFRIPHLFRHDFINNLNDSSGYLPYNLR